MIKSDIFHEFLAVDSGASTTVQAVQEFIGRNLPPFITNIHPEETEA